MFLLPDVGVGGARLTRLATGRGRIPHANHCYRAETPSVYVYSIGSILSETPQIGQHVSHLAPQKQQHLDALIAPPVFTARRLYYRQRFSRSRPV